MKNRKKLAPTLLLVLTLALAPLSRAGEPTTPSLGPLEWLNAWIASLVEEDVEQPEAKSPCAGQAAGDQSEGGPLIIPSG